MTYVERLERHNAQLEAENRELRFANKSLQSSKNGANDRVATLEKEKLMLIDELDRLRAQVAPFSNLPERCDAMQKRIMPSVASPCHVVCQVIKTSEVSRDHEITSMFLNYDNENLRSQIGQISGQNAALASGLIGTPMDPTAGQLFTQGSISDEGSPAFNQHLLELQAAMDSAVPALPTTPLERAKYPTKDRVKCLLAKVGVLPGQNLEWEPCMLLQGAVDATEADQFPQLEKLCREICKGGLPYDMAVGRYTELSSASIARAEKALGLTTVHYHPVQHVPVGE